MVPVFLATNPGKQTNIKVICPPGTEHKDIYNFERCPFVERLHFI